MLFRVLLTIAGVVALAYIALVCASVAVVCEHLKKEATGQHGDWRK